MFTVLSLRSTAGSLKPPSVQLPPSPAFIPATAWPWWRLAADETQEKRGQAACMELGDPLPAQSLGQIQLGSQLLSSMAFQLLGPELNWDPDL